MRNTFFNKGYSVRNSKRGDVQMHVFGASIGASNYPIIQTREGKNIVLPRPVKNSKPNEQGEKVMKMPWFKELVQLLEKLTIEHQYKLNERGEYMNMLNYIKKEIHPTLRIANSCFTQMVVIQQILLKDQIGNPSGIKEHIDEDDFLTCIVTLGGVMQGGNTNYYDGVTRFKKIQSLGKLQKTVPFAHGQIQIGNYSDIIHGVTPWVGDRVTLNFHIQISVINHFLVHGNSAYDGYRKKGFPAKYYTSLKK